MTVTLKQYTAVCTVAECIMRSHPTMQGTYLAACVFYATLFRQSPLGLSFDDGLAPDIVRTLQTLAAHVVLVDSWRWNLQ